MTAKEPIESRLEKLGRAIGSDESIVNHVMSRIESIKPAQNKYEEFNSNSLLRKFYLSRFTKFAAAAVIVLGVILGVKVLLNDLERPMYALGQTIEACRNKQQAHFTFSKDDKLFKAAWVEYNSDGNLARVRVDRRIDVNSESNEMFIWEDGHTKFYNPAQKLVMYFDDEDYSARVLHFVNRYDPRQAVEYMQELEQKGDVQITIEQPSDRSKPIMVTVSYEPNTFLLDSNYPPMREVMLADQTTKLVKAVEVWGPGKDFGHEEDEWTLLGTYKYDGYDEPFEEEIFDLEKEIGEDVNIIDMKTVDSGLEFTEPNLTEEQMAMATVRKYYELLIAKDYNEAVRLTGAFTAESRAKRREAWDNANLNILEIISIGEPRAPKRSWGVMIVPCTITGEINGQRVEKSLENVYVRRVLGHPNRRIVEFDESSKMH